MPGLGRKGKFAALGCSHSAGGAGSNANGDFERPIDWAAICPTVSVLPSHLAYR